MKSRHIVSFLLAVAFCTLFIFNDSHGETVKCWDMYTECKTRSEGFCEQYKSNYLYWSACITGTKSLGCKIFYDSCKANKGKRIGDTVICGSMDTACKNKVDTNCKALYSSGNERDACLTGKGPTGCGAFWDLCYDNFGKTLE